MIASAQEEYSGPFDPYIFHGLPGRASEKTRQTPPLDGVSYAFILSVKCPVKRRAAHIQQIGHASEGSTRKVPVTTGGLLPLFQGASTREPGFWAAPGSPQNWPGDKRDLQSVMMIEGGRAPMSTSGIVGEEIGKQAALASLALQDISGAGANAGRLLPRAVLAMLGPYSAAKFLAERILQSDTFNVELVQALYSKMLPLERMVDDVLVAAGQRLLRRSRMRRAASLGGNPQPDWRFFRGFQDKRHPRMPR